MWLLEGLIWHAKSTTTEIDGEWVPARPLPGPWWWRVKDAWAVLWGKADAFKWPKGQ
jgi:hypothetical protein